MNSIKQLLPQEGKDFYNKTYVAALKKSGNLNVAQIIAWNEVKKRLVPGETGLIANSESFKEAKIYTFKMKEEDTKIVMNSETGELIMEAVLATTDKNTEGKSFTHQALEDINAQINMHGSTLPDVEHETLKMLVRKHGRNPDAIITDMKKEKGIFKSIKSIIRDGKLWIQAFLDKRYKNHVDKFKALSIEAFADSDSAGKLENPKYVGFTFTNTPKLKGLKIVN